MTRVNLVPVESLADQHLMAEWRELKMIPSAVKRYLKGRTVTDILRRVGSTYTLGKGHVSFFYDKMEFLENRYVIVRDELLTRNYNLSYVGDFTTFTKSLPDEFKKKQWNPTEAEIEVNKERIRQKLVMKDNWYRYCGAKKDANFFLALLDTPF